MITINFLQHRRNYIPLLVYFLKRIKPQNKNKLHINFLMTDHYDSNYWDSLQLDISMQVVKFPGNYITNNYLAKLQWFMNHSDEYCIKLDEDIILSNHLWDYIIENVDILNKEPNLLALTPVVNIGVPSVDLFIKDFCTEEEKKEIHKIFLNTDIHKTAGIRWELNFEELNQYTINTTEWNFQKFHEHVSHLETEKKGIHPIRFNFDAQMFMYNCVLNNIPKFLSLQNYYIDKYPYCYLCNDMSIILTENLHKIHHEFPFVLYDEIQMNLYKQKYKLDYGFIRNGFALHTMFAFVSFCIPNRQEFEQQLYTKLRDKIMEYNYYDL
jgi:hypothetical protein